MLTGHAKPGNVALDGAPRQTRNIGIHYGMVTTTRHDGKMRVGGGDMASALSSGSVGPALGDMLQARPKVFADTKPIPGMRNRISPDRGLDHDLGRAILAAAVGNHSNGLPKTVTEK